MMSGTSNGPGDGAYLVLALLIVIAVMRNRGMRQNRGMILNKGERLRPIAITMLDPVISIFLIGTVLWSLMMRSDGHVAAALVGAAAGIPIGMARARVMYVRAVITAKSVVFRRSAMEYGLLALLLALRIAEDSISRLHNEVATYALTTLIALAVAESITRAVAIYLHYRRDTTLGAT
ncbi:MAG: hypothetical protein ACRDVC_10880 [Acidimicrobiales bacterium]